MKYEKPKFPASKLGRKEDDPKKTLPPPGEARDPPNVGGFMWDCPNTSDRI